MEETKKGSLVMRVDIKQSILEVPLGDEVWFPIKGFTVNTIRSTAARLNAEGTNGKISVREDYNNHRVYITRQ